MNGQRRQAKQYKELMDSTAPAYITGSNSLCPFDAVLATVNQPFSTPPSRHSFPIYNPNTIRMCASIITIFCLTTSIAPSSRLCMGSTFLSESYAVSLMLTVLCRTKRKLNYKQVAAYSFVAAAISLHFSTEIQAGIVTSCQRY